MSTLLAAPVRFRNVSDAEHEGVLHLVDHAFHLGGIGRLRQTFPTALGKSNLARLYVGELDGQVVCAAAALVRNWVTTRGVLRTACLGSFATHPRWTGQGLSSALQTHCLERARDAGAAWAVLFTDRPKLYAGRGFHPCGVERLCDLQAAAWPAPPRGARVRPARPADARALLDLYLRHRLRAERPLADLQAHLEAGGSRIEVLEMQGRIRAYAAVGKGADFEAVVCEYAGPAALVHPLWGRAAAAGARAVLVPGGAEEYLTGPASAMWVQTRPAALAVALKPAQIGDLTQLGFAVWGFDSA